MITPAPFSLFLIVIFGITGAFCLIFSRTFDNKLFQTVTGCLAWLMFTAALPFALFAAGFGAAWQFPVFAFTLCLVAFLAAGRLGAAVVQSNGIALLVAIQVFRLPLEFVLIVWNDHGFMPDQMTWRGDNFDVITGMLALPVAFLIARRIQPKISALAFNAFGLAMLLKIIWIVALSSPTPLRTLVGGYQSGPDVLVGLYFPSVWIASVAVAGAFFLHVASLFYLAREWKARKAPLGALRS